MKKIKFSILLLSIFIFSNNGYSQTWNPLASGTSSVLGSVDFVNDQVGLVVGSAGLIRKTTDGGATWTTQSSGVSADLNEVVYSDLNTAYAVGRSGVILKTVNGGTNWTSLTTGTSADLMRICVNGSDVYATGYSGTILKSTNGGISWTALSSGTTTYLYGVHFTDANTGYVVGYQGTILKTTNAGTTWTALTSGSSMQLLCVKFTDSNNGYVVGGNISSNTGAILKTTDAGATWTSQTIANNYFGNVRFLNSNIGFIAGGSITANTSTILKTIDAGLSWTVQATSVARQFGLSIPNGSAGYSSGLNGAMLKTVGIVGVEEQNSYDFGLNVFPNPIVAENTFVQFALDKESKVRLNVFDVNGKECMVITEQNMPAGKQEVKLDPSTLASGIYFIRIQTIDGLQTIKIIKEK